MSTRHPVCHSKSQTIAFLTLGIALGTPSVVLANVGTPLIWATIFHLYVGNAFIGILEGTLLARVYIVPASRAVGLMILANYFSAWVGWAWLSGLLQDRADLNLYNAWTFIWGIVLVAYVATLLIEWPFVAGCFRGRENWFRKSCGASLLVQTVSYVLLFGWFYLVGVNSLLTDATIVSLDKIPLPSDVRVYYIAEADGDVYSMKLDTGLSEKVFDLNSRDDADCLSFEDSESQKGSQEIVSLLESGDVKTGIFVPKDACPQYDDHNVLRTSRFARAGIAQGIAAKLGTAFNSPWESNAGYWAAQGLSGENSKTGDYFRLALETPFIQWSVRHAMVLPTNKVLFQLGKRQICIFDPETRKLAVLSFGRGAVAVLEHSSSQSP